MDEMITVPVEKFIGHETSRVFGADFTEGLSDLLRTAGVSDVRGVELAAFRFWMTLAAASLANVPDGVKRGLYLNVFDQAERIHGAWTSCVGRA
jgi:hypothetical protein